MPSAAAPAVVALASSAVVEPSKYTDQANAERFVAAHKDDVKWVETWKTWLYFDGVRWAKDDHRKVEEYAQEVVRNIYVEAAGISKDSERQECARWAAASDKGSQHKIMLERAKPLLSARADTFDIDPDVLNCANGTVDLKTGVLLPHNPDGMLTKLAPVNYDPAAPCPTWDKHLEFIFPDPDVREFLQPALGYSMTGRVGERVIFYNYGKGCNGKSETLNAVQNILGDYAMTASPTLMVRDRNRTVDLRALAELRGKRFVVTIDQQEAGQKLSEATLKMIASKDAITGQRMYQAQETFVPTHTIWLAVNDLLVIQETNDAVWDRIVQIPFTVRIPDSIKDPDFDKKLAAEYEGILAWLVRGAVEYYSKGLVIPKVVREATAAYREDMDLFGSFLEVCADIAPSNSISKAEFIACYTQWCKNSNTTPWSEKRVTRTMRDRNFTEGKTGGVRKWLGITVINPAHTSFGDSA